MNRPEREAGAAPLRPLAQIIAERDEVVRRLDAATQAGARPNRPAAAATAESDLRRLAAELVALQRAALDRCSRDLERLRRSCPAIAD